MKKILVFAGLLAVVFILASCSSNDPKENGSKVGKLQCESIKLQAEYEALYKKLYEKDPQNEEDRADMAQIYKEINKIELQSMKFQEEFFKIYIKRYDLFENKEKFTEYDSIFRAAVNEYLEQKCEAHKMKVPQQEMPEIDYNLEDEEDFNAAVEAAIKEAEKNKE